MSPRADAHREMVVAGRPVGPGHPTYVIAELSANHGQRLERAEELVRAAAEAGADAVKLQTYTAGSMTLDSDNEVFRVAEGTLWSGRTLYDLYEEAHTPWDWLPKLQAVAHEVGLELLSSPFDTEAVDFLVEHDVPALKIASFELVDLELIAYAASKGRPLIVSTGMATAEEIDAGVVTALEAGAAGVALLRCNSAYPAPPEEMDLRTIPDMLERWRVPVGLSDHTLGSAAAAAAVAVGATVLEKHLTMSRAEPGPDSAFSLEPLEFGAMVTAVRETEKVLGRVRYGPSSHEEASLGFRRSLFVVSDLGAGERYTRENLRAIRPGHGLPPSSLEAVLGRRAARAVERGTPLSWDLVEGGERGG
ncbi:MAG: N-acylneuraminate-9-phosphate synthase [Acidimicrobiales bacterium]|nr:N-acylneuraminate-9-phosphate synthase [Acidimicrobiales bacterium]